MSRVPLIPLLLWSLALYLASDAARAEADPETNALEARLLEELRTSAGVREIEAPQPEEPLRAGAASTNHAELGAAFLVGGRTTLPDRAVLQVALHFHGESVLGGSAIVETGRFEVLLGPYAGKRAFPGVYRLSLGYSPHRQPDSLDSAPGEPFEVSLETRVGSSEEEELALLQTRRGYAGLLARIDRFALELDGSANGALDQTRFTIGEKREFDSEAWRDWLSGWRRRLEDEVAGSLYRSRDQELVAVPLPRALQAVLGLVAWHSELARLRSIEIYETKGRAMAPEDRVPEGGALVDRGAVEEHIQDLTRQVEEIVSGKPREGSR